MWSESLLKVLCLMGGMGAGILGIEWMNPFQAGRPRWVRPSVPKVLIVFYWLLAWLLFIGCLVGLAVFVHVKLIFPIVKSRLT